MIFAIISIITDMNIYIKKNPFHKFMNKSIMKPIFILFFLASAFISFGQKGHEIKVKIANFSADSIYLAYYLGDKQYLTDTTYRSKDGSFTFKGDDAYDCGNYLVVLPPNNAYFQVFLDDDQTMTFETDSMDIVEKMKVTGSKENEAFFDYLHFIGSKRPEADKLHKEQEGLDADSEKFKAIDKKLDALDDEVAKYQKKLVKDNEGTVLALTIKAGMEITPPDTDDKLKIYNFYKNHWFDNYDVSSPCILRTPGLNSRIDYYLDKLLPHHPDSISLGVDKVLSLVKDNEDLYQFYLAHLLNKFAASKIVGMDAVYVHIVENYYAKGDRADIDKEQLDKIIDNAEKLKPLLIGKIAPNITIRKIDVEGTLAEYEKQYAVETPLLDEKSRLERKIKSLKKSKQSVPDSLLTQQKAVEKKLELVDRLKYKRFKLKEPVTLHDVDSPYTIVFIWSPTCGHCKKAMPDMIDFYNKYHDKGVEIYAIGHMKYTDTYKVAEFLRDHPEMRKWINVTDPFFKSKYQTLYDVHSTPQLYILDKNKEILTKKIGAKQLGEVMDQIFEIEQKKSEDEKK